jgi:glycosyltransferase involved in cell wall biosynthesis
MKLLSVIVPCYNSQDYMAHCLETLLSYGRDEVEIIVVDDGSKDRTGAIADDFAARYPGTVRAIHQANAGHGGAVNAGVRVATGLYAKVVDSDDWVDEAAYRRTIDTLRGLSSEGKAVDMVVCNFVYEKQGTRRKKAMRYRGYLPPDRAFGWDDIRDFRLGLYLLMHSIIYRTGLLRECGLVLPEHTFYVDNLWAFLPFDAVRSLYYLDVDLYRYFIGRGDQSVNEAVMIKRIDQQLSVNRAMIENKNLAAVENRKLRRQMFHQVEIITAVSSIMLIRSGTDEALRKKAELWSFIRERDPYLYRKLRSGFYGVMVNLPGRLGRRASIGLYKLAQRLFGFN